MRAQALRTVAFVFFAALLQGTFTPVFACECDTTPPPCRAVWQSTVVFSGRVERIEQVKAPPPDYSHYLVTFSVDQVVRGDRASRLVIKTADSQAACGYEFHEGESYLVYGYSQRGATWTGVCGRTRPLKEGAEDLKYAAGLSRTAAGGFIYGELRRWDDYLGRGEVTRGLGTMADVPIVVNGPGGPRRTRSRRDGTFQVTGLQPGTYRVTLELPETLMYSGFPESIQLASPHACERADFAVHFDGRIRATVQDARGAPVVGANVTLALAELADDPVGLRNGRSAVTDMNGQFELKTLPPGRYVLGLNIDPRLDNMVVLLGIRPRVFHPGSPDSANATRIELGRGEKRTLPPLRLPGDLIARNVTGNARWPDGRPVAEGWVSLLDAETKLRLSGIVRTTATGEFTVTAFVGQRVFAQVEAKDGERGGYIESPRFEVGPATLPDPITLTVVPRP